MSRIDIGGIGIAYELLGEAGAPAVALTFGGRFAMTTPGLRELGERLAEGGKRVLLWDRPNCGQSDLCLDGDTESQLHSDVLAALIRKLDLGPTALAGGSAGSRVSLIAGSQHPALISHLVLWNITGGPIGLMGLAMVYAGEAAQMVNSAGTMEAATKAFGWAEQCETNPRVRDALLAQDPRMFVAKMQQWAAAYAPSATSPVPGMTPEAFAAIAIPVLILRNGSSDLSHTRETTDWVHRLIPHSRMEDPPWGDREWIERGRAVKSGEAKGLFVNWPKLAPVVLDFTD